MLSIRSIPFRSFLHLKFSISGILYESVTERRTDGPTDGPTDTPTYTDAGTHLKKQTVKRGLSICRDMQGEKKILRANIND